MQTFTYVGGRGYEASLISFHYHFRCDLTLTKAKPSMQSNTTSPTIATETIPRSNMSTNPSLSLVLAPSPALSSSQTPSHTNATSDSSQHIEADNPTRTPHNNQDGLVQEARPPQAFTLNEALRWSIEAGKAAGERSVPGPMRAEDREFLSKAMSGLDGCGDTEAVKVCTCMCVCIYIYIHLYIYVCVCVCVYVSLRVNVSLGVYGCVCLCERN